MPTSTSPLVQSTCTQMSSSQAHTNHSLLFESNHSVNLSAMSASLVDAFSCRASRSSRSSRPSRPSRRSLLFQQRTDTFLFRSKRLQIYAPLIELLGQGDRQDLRSAELAAQRASEMGTAIFATELRTIQIINHDDVTSAIDRICGYPWYIISFLILS